MASTMATNSVINTGRSTAARNKKKKKSTRQNQTHNVNNHNGVASWKSEAQQHVYSSKLLHALRQVRLNSAPKRGRAVREAADRALAVAAKGRTRWSRAILTNRLKLKFMKKNNNNKRIQRVVTGNSRLQKKNRVSILRLKTKNAPTFQRKVKVLSRLVPGCRKQPLPIVLEEATDYIAALEMQVRVMSKLAELLSGAGSSSAGAGPVNPLGSSRPCS